MYKDFINDVKKFNDMYGIESNNTPVDLGQKRIDDFIQIYCDELDEFHDLKGDPRTDIDARVELADWLSDLYIYLASEARRWGCPNALNGSLGFSHEHLRMFYFRQGQMVMDHLTTGNIAYVLYSLGLQVSSIALRYGIPLEQTLKIIMYSNFSKLGTDGKPITDINGKVKKGPFYQPPEPELKVLFENLSRNV